MEAALAFAEPSSDDWSVVFWEAILARAAFESGLSSAAALPCRARCALDPVSVSVFADPAARARSRGLFPVAFAGTDLAFAGAAFAFVDAAFDSGLGTLVRNSSAMSNQPILLVSANSTSALPFILTVLMTPTCSPNRASSGWLVSTTT